MNPAVAALLRTVIIAAVSAALTAALGALDAYQAPFDAGYAFAVILLVARFVLEGLYDLWRRTLREGVPISQVIPQHEEASTEHRVRVRKRRPREDPPRPPEPLD
jgi:hypothetical protein